MITKPRATDALMGELHQAVAADLLKRVKSGEATAQELSQAIKFLDNNGIQGETGDLEDEVKAKSSDVVLPQFDDEELTGSNV